MWLCCQVCLLAAKKTSSFTVLALDPKSKTRFDLHLFVGEIVVPEGLDMQLFQAPHVAVGVMPHKFQVAGAARVQCLCVERFEQTTLSAAVRHVHANRGPPTHALRGMPTVQDLWSLLHHCEKQFGAQSGAGASGTGAELHTGAIMDMFRRAPAAIADGAASGAAPGAAPAPGAATPVAPAATAPAALTKFKWADSGAMVIGFPGAGLAKPRAGASSSASSPAASADFEHLQAPKPVGGARDNNWKQRMALVAEYYDAVCATLHTRFFAEMTWVPVGQQHHNYLADLKKLKAESRRDISVLQSRAQTAELEQLGMLNSLGFQSGAERNNLSNACMGSLYDTLPAIDPRLETYIATFHAPNVALFLRLIRCTNLMAFEHLTKTHGAPELKDEFQRRLRHFPLGTAADLDYIMQYTASNAKNVHSIYLQPVKLPVTQSANVSRSRDYAWVSDLLDSISKHPETPLDEMLPNSPLARKLLLCHRKVYELLHSVRVRLPDSTLLPLPVVSETDTMQMHQRIVRGLMQDKTMYYVFAVDRHVQVSYAARREENRSASDDSSSNTRLRALQADDSEESDEQHNERLESTPIQFTRMTWPLRDLNVYTRISLPVVKTDGECQSIAYPGNFSFAHSDMDTHEKEMYDWLEKVQNSQLLRRQREVESLDTDTSVNRLPLIPVPLQMLSQCRVLNERQCAVRRDGNLNVGDADTDSYILQAWRWKSLLLKITVLSALNGICEELKTRELSHGISAFNRVGTEVYGGDLVLQNYVWIPTSRSPEYVVRTRIFDTEQTNDKYKNRNRNIDSNSVELLKCKFSLKQKGTKFFSKLIRRSTSLHKDEEYLVKKSGCIAHVLETRDKSWNFVSSAETSTNEWFDFL